MRIAVPVLRGRVSPLLDSARSLLIVELDGESEKSRRYETLEGPGPAERMAQISGLNCDWVICGAVSPAVAFMLASRGVRILPWVAGDVEDVIPAFAEKRLSATRFLMPGCRRRGRFGMAGRGGRGCRKGPGRPGL